MGQPEDNAVFRVFREGWVAAGVAKGLTPEAAEDGAVDAWSHREELNRKASETARGRLAEKEAEARADDKDESRPIARTRARSFRVV
jgi:hypothetical protein